MRVGSEIPYGKQQVEGGGEVVHLGEHGVLAVNHRVGIRRALAEMDNCLRLEFQKDALDQGVVLQISTPERDGLTGFSA